MHIHVFLCTNVSFFEFEMLKFDCDLKQESFCILKTTFKVFVVLLTLYCTSKVSICKMCWNECTKCNFSKILHQLILHDKLSKFLHSYTILSLILLRLNIHIFLDLLVLIIQTMKVTSLFTNISLNFMFSCNVYSFCHKCNASFHI